MPWVVDTSVLIDILEDDPDFGRSSAAVVDAHAPEGLLVCPLTYVELAPAFGGDRSLQDEFLAGVGISFDEGWSRSDTLAAHAAWNRHIVRKRAGRGRKRPLADILIGAFAEGRQGLITRNPGDFADVFPDLVLRMPEGG